jgi:hypothetical protein
MITSVSRKYCIYATKTPAQQEKVKEKPLFINK